MRPEETSRSAVEVPLWVRLADIAAAVSLALATWVLLFGGIRFYVGDVRLSSTTMLRPLALGLLLLAVRHRIHPKPTFRDQARTLRDRWIQRLPPGTAEATRTLVGTRATILLAGYIAVHAFGYAQPPPFRVSGDELWNLPARWDAGWYLSIATEGYRWNPNFERQQNIAFFPAYPALVAVGGRLLGAERGDDGEYVEGSHQRFALAGTLVSLIAFWLALLYVFALARQHLDARQSGAALLLLGAYPFAVFYGIPYTESLFLLAAAGAFYHAMSDDWVTAGAWGLLAGLARPNGCFLSVPLAVLVLMRSREWIARRQWGPAIGAWTAAAMPGIGMLAFSAFLYGLTGRYLAWAAAHAAWGRNYAGLDGLITDHYRYIAEHGVTGYIATLPLDVLNGSAAVLALGVAIPIARRFHLAYAVFIAVNVLPPLMMGGFLSIGRVTATLFPIFLYLARVVPDRHVTAWVVAFLMLQALAAAMFFTWRPFL